MHVTSLPGRFGIGDLGPAAHDFLEFLDQSGHAVWQLLPLNPTSASFSHSPYSSYSAFAGNPLLISPEILENEGFIHLKDFPLSEDFESGKVVFPAVERFKKKVLDQAFQHYQKTGNQKARVIAFSEEHAHWLDDYALFMALRKKYRHQKWVDWPREVRDRKSIALEAAQKELEEDVEREKFVQFLFFSQWSELVKAAQKKEIRLFGDVPFYVNHDSSDCWSNPSLFKLDQKKLPTHISGVPPDLFSETGQLWGTPVYDWKALKQKKFDWWLMRLRQNLLLFDLVRLDHFRAFSAYWEVPAGEETAADGKWVKTPGDDFFNLLKKEFPDLPFVAEDLGDLDQPVYNLLKKFDFPGMRILQFAFGEEDPENPYLPFNHEEHSLVYTGTHDNNTTRGWFRRGGKDLRKHLREYLGRRVTSTNVHLLMHRMALESVAKLAITPLQDLLGLGEEALMNVPGTIKGNWTWRLTTENMPQNSKQLRHLNQLFGRCSAAHQSPRSSMNQRRDL